MGVLAALLLIAWCLLTMQTLLNLSFFRQLETASFETKAAPRVSIIIPARNEERYVGRTLDAALGQDYPDFEVVIVDDGSTDATAGEISRRESNDKLVALKARPLEPGWLGKPNALATGAASASGDWLLFMDADVELHPQALRDAVSTSVRNGWDYLSLFPRFDRHGFWEEVLMPVIPAVALIYMPSFLAFFRWTRIAFGSGAFGLVRRTAYEAIGGHATIKNSVVDDVRLAMETKKAGFVTAARSALDRVRLRMYHGRQEIMEGFTKNAHAVYGEAILAPVVSLLVSLWLSLTPFAWPLVALAAPSEAVAPPMSWLGLSLGLLLFCRALVQLRFRLPMWPILFSPLTTLTTLLIVLRSLRMAHAESVVRWRGREYPRGSTEF